MAKLSEERVLPPFRRAVQEELKQEHSSPDAPKNEYQFFELARNQVAPVGFKILFGDGRVAGIQYHDIVSPLEYDGAGLITLKTPALQIKITGKNLRPLFDMIFENRVSLLREPDTSFVEVEENQPQIETINLQSKE